MLRLILVVLLFLSSLLTLFTAPAYYLWLLAVMVGEYGLLFIAATVLILTSGWIFKSRHNVAATVIGLLAILIFTIPIVSAYIIARDLPAKIQRELNMKADDHSQPFSFTKLFHKDPISNPQVFKYASYNDTSLTLDYYAAKASGGKRPCIVVVHGGSWSSGESKQLSELNTLLANKGYNVASINYRLAPKWQSPAPVEDVDSALGYLNRHAQQLHIDTNRLVLLGRSAGAQIALLAAYTLKRTGIKGVIDFYGPADMVWGYSLPAPKLVMDSRRVMANYLGGYYPQVPQNYKSSSPVEYVNAQTVPTLIIHGGNDPLVAYDHSRRLSEKLKRYNVPYYWLKLPWATHGFDHHLNGPGGQLSTYTLLRFLDGVVPVRE